MDRGKRDLHPVDPVNPVENFALSDGVASPADVPALCSSCLDGLNDFVLRTGQGCPKGVEPILVASQATVHAKYTTDTTAMTNE